MTEEQYNLKAADIHDAIRRAAGCLYHTVEDKTVIVPVYGYSVIDLRIKSIRLEAAKLFRDRSPLWIWEWIGEHMDEWKAYCAERRGNISQQALPGLGSSEQNTPGRAQTTRSTSQRCHGVTDGHISQFRDGVQVIPGGSEAGSGPGATRR